MRQLRKHAPAVPLPIVGTIHFAIMKQDNLAVLGEFLHKRDNIDPARVTPEASLEELKVDSLLLLELLFEFEDRLGIKIPRDIRRPKTVGDLLGIVEKLQAGKGV
jgi:acyl carrier protein